MLGPSVAVHGPAMEPDLIGQEKKHSDNWCSAPAVIPAMEPDLIGQEKGSRETERLARRDAAARERLGGEAVLDL